MITITCNGMRLCLGDRSEVTINDGRGAADTMEARSIAVMLRRRMKARGARATGVLGVGVPGCVGYDEPAAGQLATVPADAGEPVAPPGPVVVFGFTPAVQGLVVVDPDPANAGGLE